MNIRFVVGLFFALSVMFCVGSPMDKTNKKEERKICLLRGRSTGSFTLDEVKEIEVEAKLLMSLGNDREKSLARRRFITGSRGRRARSARRRAKSATRSRKVLESRSLRKLAESHNLKKILRHALFKSSQLKTIKRTSKLKELLGAAFFFEDLGNSLSGSDG